MPAGYAAFQLGGGPWYGYWYGVILQVVEWRRLIWDSDSQEHFVASCPHLGTDASRTHQMAAITADVR